MKDHRAPWVIVGLAGLCLLCLVPALVLGSAAGNRAGDAVSAALARDNGADSDQQVTAVVVGFLNFGSGNVTQTSTTTATRPEARQAAPNPWPVIFVISGLVLLAVFAALVLFRPEGES